MSIFILTSVLSSLGIKVDIISAAAVLPTKTAWLDGDNKKMKETVTPEYPTSEQSWIREGQTESDANPGVYLYQNDAHEWVGETVYGDQIFPATYTNLNSI
ncbi:hypothetical protein D3C86_1699900 [compost metagenome]